MLAGRRTLRDSVRRAIASRSLSLRARGARGRLELNAGASAALLPRNGQPIALRSLPSLSGRFFPFVLNRGYAGDPGKNYTHIHKHANTCKHSWLCLSTTPPPDLPEHTVMKLPALSPTMEVGMIVSWEKAVGDELGEGDVLAQVSCC